MKLFVVTVEGIYRHQIVGVYDSLEGADVCALEHIGAEKDDYHEVAVSQCESNTHITDVERLYVYLRKGRTVSRRPNPK